MSLSTVKKLGVILFVLGVLATLLTLFYLFQQFGDWGEFFAVLIAGGIIISVFFFTASYAKKVTRVTTPLEAGLWAIVISSLSFSILFPLLTYLAFTTEQAIYLVLLSVFTILAIAAFIIGLILFIVGRRA